MASYVYLITNILTNKHYIGKTNNKNVRWSQHKSRAKSENTYLYNSFRKYGTQNFTFQIIKECDTEYEALRLERVLIALFNLRDKKYGYNIVEGGDAGNTGYKVSKKLKRYFKKKYTGSKSVRAKYSNEEIISILTEYATGMYTAQELSQKYQCGKSTMIRIISGESYGDVKFDRSNFKNLGITNRLTRIPRGTSVKTSKLSDDEVVKIRDLRATENYTLQQLADQFGVTKTNISYIVNNKSRRK
jgi:group I intron endonuclease